jgi:carbonic anhydrase
MIKSMHNVCLIAALVLGLSACSMFSRHNDQKEADQATPAAATPLDMPAATPVPAPDDKAATDKPAGEGPTVTLVKKGTNEPIEQKPDTHTNMWSKTFDEKSEGKPAAAAPSEPAAEHEAAAGPAPKSAWAYDGDNGPEHWASLNKRNETCADGKAQSPVDLKWHKPSKSEKISFNYKPTAVHVENNGHTIMAAFDAGDYVTYNGKKYELTQAHFHTPSEHTFSGKTHPIELHFVHKTDKGEYLVLAAEADEGEANPMVAKIWAAIPKEKNLASDTEVVIKPEEMMPTTHTHYGYSGSLTTPPCTENVHWVVFNTPITMSADQIQAFQNLYPQNARPIQPLNKRKVQNF